MFGIVGKILGSDTVIEKGLQLIDDAWTSKSEESEMRINEEKAKIDAKVRLLESYKPFQLAQRYIALMFTAVFLFILINGILGCLYGWIEMKNVEKAIEFSNKLWLGEIVLTIVAFYFGGGTIESFKKTKETK